MQGKKHVHTQREPEVPLGNITTPVLWLVDLHASVQNGSTLLAWWGWPFPSHHPCRWRRGFLVTSESATSWEGIGFAVAHCIPVLFGRSIGIHMPVVLQLPTHIIGPDTTTASVSLSSSSFQYPLEPAPLAINADILYEWICPPLPVGCCTLFLNPTESCSESAGTWMWVIYLTSSGVLS